ncbi:MAG: hypothetical protein IT174_07320 [Acidobacteria bacterium]|nr:hypothetical protein [Acidobacteriota bacterium]
MSEPPAVAGGLTGMTNESQLKTAIRQPPATAGGSDSKERQSLSANRAAQPWGKVGSRQRLLLALDDRGIKVADYWTQLPDKKLLERKLHEAVIMARQWSERPYNNDRNHSTP